MAGINYANGDYASAGFTVVVSGLIGAKVAMGRTSMGEEITYADIVITDLPEEELAAFNPRSFYDEETAQRERERLENRVARLREGLRRERRSRWENHQKLRREKRDLVRELAEVEDDGEILTYLDRV